jgi:hypothetical protein
MKTSSKVALICLFVLPVIIVTTVYLIALKPWEHYSHNGPLATKSEVTTTSPEVKVGNGVVFGGLNLENQTDRPIQVIAIDMPNISSALSSDATFKSLGISKGIKAITETDLKNDQVEKLPFTIPAGSKDYQPVIELIPNKAGTFTLDGVIITYKYQNKLYRDYFADHFIIKAAGK